MIIKELKEILESVDEDLDIDFEDDKGNTLFKLDDLDFADVDLGIIRLQNNKKCDE